MNKQDKKEVMNLIKYKKMFGGRRMNIEKAIEILKDNDNVNDILENCGCKVMSAIDTVLRSYNAILTNYNALEEDMDKQYNKGYQDGFKQAKFDCEMDKLDGR